ncbi:MAG: D-alanine--D-alanine ligase [Actinobacteria bacterium]|nr:D-alanine--D-alanine ligase [Actinomycetota bacterium]
MGSSPSPPARARLVVLFGGRSAEHDVSCVSAASVLGALDPARYEIRPVGITRDGRWVAATGWAVEGGSAPAALAAEGPEVDSLATVASDPEEGDVPTVVLPLLHGPLGEDGTVQGLLELAGVAYVGAGVLGSALCMDKAKAKEVLAHHGLPQARYVALSEVEVDAGLGERVGAELGWPVFVKPANLGSSVGISKVEGPAGLDEAMQLALAYDEWVVVEEGVTGREIECGVLGDLELVASVPGEIVPSREFYDYEDKYSGDGADLVVPASLPHDVAEEVRRLAVAAARALRAEGMARVDFFWEENGRGLLVNEVNTIPGFTPHSMYPRLWEASGVPYADLIDRLVTSALERHRRRSERVGRPRRAGPT